MATDYKSVLKKILGEDQSMVMSNKDDPEKFIQLNKKHLKIIDEILKEIREPRISILGYNGALTVWIVVQHADHDPSLQKYYLRLFKKLYEKDPDDTYKEGIAYLEDRILVKEKVQQLYGTQFKDSALSKNTLEPYPILNHLGLEERRKKMGLQPMNDYIKELKRVCGKEVIYSDK